MKRKVYILTLLGVFFISTTGLPLTLSFCSMNDSHPSGHCKMHMETMKNGCCSKDVAHNEVKLTEKDFDSCCQFKIVDHNITDKFLISGNDTGTKTPVKALVTFNSFNYGSQIILSQNTYTDGSPPPLPDNHLYLSNSILLI
jgi:hypothetical protein